jgi:glucose-6-phosphate dehydrogenase assembly protein OpcA
MNGDRLATFEKGEAIEVPLAKVESELAALWRQAAAPRAGEKPRAITRACLWNLAVRVEGEEKFRISKQLVDDISKSVPARAIVLHAEPGLPDAPIRAWVEANWRRPEGGHASGSDEVTLLATGRAVERLPSAVRALLVTDAPVAMLWVSGNLIPGHDGPAAPAESLLGDIDRLIVDSRQLPDERDLGGYLTLYELYPRLVIVDLSWLGVRPLRGLCAALFDPPHDPRPLELLDRVRVTSGVRGTQSRALYTIGWLAAQLGWRDYRRETGATDLRRWRATRRAGGEVVIELLTKTGAASHGVVGLELEAGGSQWSLERAAGAIDVRAPGLPRRLQPVRSHSDAELVTSALGVRGRDPMFPKALAETVRLVGAT